MDTKLCGIYSIKNKTNEKIYIGQKVICNGYLYWRAVIKLSGKTCFIGQYKDEVTAAKKYNEFVIKNSLRNPINIFEGITENG
jgi:hypothetical protein